MPKCASQSSSVCGLARSREQHPVVVVANEAVGEHTGVHVAAALGQHVQENAPVLVVHKDGLATVTPGDWVVDGAGKLNAKGRAMGPS